MKRKESKDTTCLGTFMSLYLVFLTDITRKTGLTRERRMTIISYLTSHGVYTEKAPEFVIL